MNEEKLDKELVRRPELWQLSMRLAPHDLDVMLYSPVENNSLIYRHIALDPDADTQLTALESAVYDNPLLLSEFGRISIVVDTPSFMAMPPEITDPEQREELFKAAFPSFDGRLFDNALGASNAVMTLGLEENLAGFLERTFFNVRVFSHLTPLCRYFVSSAGRANARRMYANLRPGAVDLVVVDHAHLLMINTMTWREPMDAVYYILASYRSAGLDPMDTDLLVAGPAPVREKIVPTLRNYVASVMPVIFPSTMFKAGKDAMKAPFDLIVLPLCE